MKPFFNPVKSNVTQERKNLWVFSIASIVASLILPFTYTTIIWQETLNLLLFAFLFLGGVTYFLIRGKHLKATYILVCYINWLLIYNVWLTNFSNQVIFFSGFAVAVSILANEKMKHKGICILISVAVLNVLCLSYQYIPVRHPSPVLFSVVGLTVIQLLNLVGLIVWAQSRKYQESSTSFPGTPAGKSTITLSAFPAVRPNLTCLDIDSDLFFASKVEVYLHHHDGISTKLVHSISMALDVISTHHVQIILMDGSIYTETSSEQINKLMATKAKLFILSKPGQEIITAGDIPVIPKPNKASELEQLIRRILKGEMRVMG